MEIIKNCVNFFYNGGIFMYPLVACSVLVIAAVFYRLFNMRKSCIAPQKLMLCVDNFLNGSSDKTALAVAAEKSDSVLGRLITMTLTDDLSDEASLKESIQAKAREEFVTLQAGLPLLDMIVMIAPMFGILGTASGLVEIFSVFGTEDINGTIAQGIAQALNTTIAGLAIATPAVIAHVYFSRKLEQVAARLEVIMTDLIAALCRK